MKLIDLLDDINDDLYLVDKDIVIVSKEDDNVVEIFGWLKTCVFEKLNNHINFNCTVTNSYTYGNDQNYYALKLVLKEGCIKTSKESISKFSI